MNNPVSFFRSVKATSGRISLSLASSSDTVTLCVATEIRPPHSRDGLWTQTTYNMITSATAIEKPNFLRKINHENSKPRSSHSKLLFFFFFRPTPRAGGYLQMKMEVKEKVNPSVKFDGYKNLISRVEDMEKAKYRIEKTVVKNPRAPTITPIRNLNLPKVSQESLFDKCLVENEDNGM